MMMASDDYIEPPEEPTLRAIRQMVVQNHQIAETGHKRLRNDLRDLEFRITEVEAANTAEAQRLTRLDDAIGLPVEVSALRFSPTMVVSIVALCASIIGGQYVSTSGLRSADDAIRSELRSVTSKVDAISQQHTDSLRVEDERVKASAKQEDERLAASRQQYSDFIKLQDERYKAQADALRELKSQQVMLDLKIQNLKDAISKARP